MVSRFFKVLIPLAILLSSCGGVGEGDGLNCESVLVNPPNGPPYWMDICTEDGGGVPVQYPEQGGQK